MPLVSVVIPTLQRANLVVRAINSVLAQTLTDIEIIVVIDGQDAETSAALALISDDHVRIVQNQVSLGPGRARNIGARAAEGLWVAFLDDDDEWLPQKLERQLAAADSPNDRVIITCLSQIVTPRRRYVWPRRIYDNIAPIDEYLFDRRSFFVGESYLGTSSIVIPRAFFGVLEFSPQTSCEDWDFWLRASKIEAARIITVEEALSIAHLEEDRESLSRTASWRDSLAWADSKRSLIGRRAYSGFCLTIVAPEAARSGSYLAFFKLLWRACYYGRPRAIHLLTHFGFGVIPIRWRRLARALLSPAQGTT